MYCSSNAARLDMEVEVEERPDFLVYGGIAGLGPGPFMHRGSSCEGLRRRDAN